MVDHPLRKKLIFFQPINIRLAAEVKNNIIGQLFVLIFNGNVKLECSRRGKCSQKIATQILKGSEII